jgi:ribosomal protein S18 acetylase RimI-like enzyme
MSSASRSKNLVNKRVERETVSLRPIAAHDDAFLCALYGGTRADEMALLDWSAKEKNAFLRMQFDAQHRHYQTHFPNAAFWIIELEGEPIGRLYVDRRVDEIRLIDVALLPVYRNRGLGSALMRELLDEATSAGKSVRLHVESFNPAHRLYTRLGFCKLDSNGVYEFMEWRPAAVSALNAANAQPNGSDFALETGTNSRELP